MSVRESLKSNPMQLNGARCRVGCDLACRMVEYLTQACALSTLLFLAPVVQAQDVRKTVVAEQYWVEEFASGLKFPSSMAWLPNGDMLVAEREGSLLLLRAPNFEPTPVMGLPPSYHDATNGLKDVALDPDFKSNRTLYLSLSDGTYERHRTAVYRARYTECCTLTSVERIFRSKDEFSSVGTSSARILFLADKTLLIAVPENNYYKQKAQQLSSHVGKILRINRDGTAPADNPFLKTPDALPEIWSYGHRQQSGLFQDQDSKAVWEVEIGPKGGDEFNLLKAGGNYGWSKVTWGFDYSSLSAGPLQSAPGVEDPVLVWMRSPRGTPSGLTRYRGAAYPSWNGDFFVGHLAGKKLERLRVDGANVVLQESMLMDLDERIRNVKVGPDGLIYLLTDHQQGRVLRLQPGRAEERPNLRVAHKLAAPPRFPGLEMAEIQPGDPIEGERAFIQRCAACHRAGTLVPGGEIGPDLADVYGRKAGSQPGFAFSAALTQSEQIWDNISLNMFMADPAGYVPGTAMTAPPITNLQVRRDIVGFLMKSSGKDFWRNN